MSAFSVEFNDYVLREGFEDGIPAAWAQEFVVGQQSWVVEAASVAEYPVGAFEGDKRVVLRNESTSTLGFTTKLVSPVMDLSSVFQPILVFAHAQQQRTGDFEHLKVYYRTTAEANWILIREFKNKIAKWQNDTIELPVTTATYQIAFEATDEMGRGVVLDDIRIRPKPTCAVPSQIEATVLNKNTVQLTWQGSFDTESFDIILAKDSLKKIDADAAAVVYKTNTTEFSSVINGLDANTQYFGYIKATCDEETDWASFKFTTPNIIELPYEQNFDMGYNSAEIFRLDDWYYGTDMVASDGSEAFIPFINTNTMEALRSSYSRSATTCLVFSGSQGGISTYIPAGSYAYTASPAIDTKDMSKLEVTFWGGCSSYQGYGVANTLQVGVMTDPNDINTFELVQEVSNKGYSVFYPFVVSLANYKGTGKHIAFLSKTNGLKNIFYLDDVKIYEPTALDAPTNVKAFNYDNEKLTITADLHGASAMNLILSKVPTTTTASTVNQYVKTDGTEPSATYIVIRKENITGNTVTIPLSELPSTYQMTTASFQGLLVYAQAVEGGKTSLWSLPAQYRMVKHNTALPVVFDFENADDKRYTKYSAGMYLTSTTNATNQVPGSVLLNRENATYGPYYVTGSVSAKTTVSGTQCIQAYPNHIFALSQLPTNVDVKALGVEFYTKAASATYANIPVEVGVMTDPYDYSTFEVVGTTKIGDNTAFTRQYIPLTDYKGNGHYLAFNFVSSATSTTLVARMDLVTVDSVNKCVAPYDLEAEADQTEADIRWVAPGMHSFKVVVSTNADLSNPIVEKTVEDTTGLHLTGLTALTKYYYQITTNCSEGASSAIADFQTACPEYAPLPYLETFNGYKTGAAGDMPSCWTMNEYWSGTSHYPYIHATASYAHGGSGYAMYFTGYMKAIYSCLPLFNEKIQNLELTFWLRPYNTSYVTKDSVMVGVMTDPSDPSTFVKVATFQPLTTTYVECVVDFSEYKGEGKYITFAKPNVLNSYYMIDDVKVDKLADCRKPRDLVFSDVKHNGATVSWKSTGAAKYQLLVMNANADPEAALADASKVVANLEVSEAKAVVVSEKMGAQSTYYAAVRSLCGEGSVSEWSSVSSFTTACEPLTVATFGVNGTETFQTTAAISCWSVGLRSGTTQKPTVTSGYLYLYSNASSEGSYAVLPPLDLDSIQQIEVSFDAHAGTVSSDTRLLGVGVASDASDLSTGVIMKTLELPVVSSVTAFNEAYRYTVRFNGYIGDYLGNKGTQPYFTTISNGKIDRIYIDNLTIEPVGDVLEPIELVIDTLGRDFVGASWETGLGKEFEVAIYDEVKTETSVAVETKTVNTNSCVFTGLKPLTTYYIYVRTKNGSNYSKWSNARWATTECPVGVSMPYYETFEGYTVLTAAPFTQPTCWVLYYNGAEYNTNARIDASAKKAGNAGLKLSSQGNVGADSYAVLPGITDDLKGACVKFSYRAATGGISKRNLLVGVATVTEPYEEMVKSITWVDTVVVTGENWLHHYSLLDNYKGNGKNVVLAFVGGDLDNFATLGNIYLDDVSVMAIPSCYSPNDPTLVQTGKDFVTVKWVDDASTSWEVAYYEDGKTLTDAAIVKTTTPEVTLTGLKQSTIYHICVRTSCSETDFSDWTAPIEAETYCLVPYAEANWGFEGTNSNLVYQSGTTYHYSPNCWIVGTTVTSSPAYYIPWVQKNTESSTSKTIYSHSGDQTLCLEGQQGYYSYAIMPEVDANLDSLQLRFYVRMCSRIENLTNAANSQFDVEGFNHGQDSVLMVGVIDNPADIKNVKPIYTYKFDSYVAKPSPMPDNNYWDEVVIPLYGLNGKYIVFYSDPQRGFTYSYIDDVTLEPATGCITPSQITANEATLTDTSADIEWLSAGNKWNVKVLDPANKNIYEGVINGKATLHLDNLESNATYTVNVQTLCDGDNRSDVLVGTIKTLCTTVDTIDSKWNFETNLEKWGSSNNSYLLPACWTVGASGSNSSNYSPRIQANSGSYAYSRTVNKAGDAASNNALLLYGMADKVYDNYAILPEAAYEIDGSMMFHFYARLGYINASTSAFTNNNPSSMNWARDIVVGYTIGNDFSTFVPCDTLYIQKSWNIVRLTTKETDRADRFWDSFILPLNKYVGKGHHICIVYNHLRQSSSTEVNYCMIDDVEIIPNEACTAPFDLNAENVTSHEAKVTWTGNGVVDYNLQVALDESFEELVLDTNLNATSYELKGLTQGTRYFFRLAHNCVADEVSDWSDVLDFTTAYAVRFHNEFPVTGAELPAAWHGGRTTTPTEAFAGKAIGQKTIFNVGDEWASYGRPDVMNPGHMACETYNNYTSTQWLLTPVIDLTDQTGKNLMFSFDLTISGIADEPTSPEVSPDLFWVLVSLDEGQTWSAQDATLWANDSAYAQHKYAEIPTTKEGKTFYIDFTKYVGKTVQIAFVSESRLVATKNMVHIDNVQLNTFVKFVSETSLCQYEDYEDEHVYIDADEIPVGKTQIERFVAANKDGNNDELVVVTTNVETIKSTKFDEFTCEGSVYENNGFNFTANQSGVWKQKLLGASALGCDSTVTLNLSVSPVSRYDTVVSMCQGSFFEVGSEKYYTSGTYNVTLSSLLTGCDSIVNVFLTITPMLEGKTEVWLCQGDSYQLGDTTITTEGTYSRLLINSLGCDSMATVDVHSANVEHTRYVKAICFGSTYSDANVSGLSAQGDYDITLTSVHGCDSIVTLHLLVADADNVINDRIMPDQLPYIFDGQELIPAGTPEGTQTFMVNLDCGITTLNVTIGEGSGVDNIFGNGEVGVQKVIFENQVYIIRNGQWYDVLGKPVK